MTRRIGFFMLILLATGALAAPSPADDWPSVAQVETQDGPDLGLGLANSLLLQDKYEEAAKLARRALTLAPENAEARVVLAKAAIAEGKLDEAQEHIDWLLRVEAENPDYYALQGMVYMFEDDTANAVVALQKARELGEGRCPPDSLASYANTLVLTYHRAGQPDQALQTCLESLRRYPQDGDLHLSCSRLFREKGDFESAARMAREGLQVDPDFYALYASLALAEQALGHREESEAAYRELLARDPQLARMLRETLDGQRPDSAEYKVRVE